MTRAYAEGTSVTVEKTRSEIDTLLGKHGASQRGVMTDDAGRAVVAFVIGGRHYRLDVPMPNPGDFPDPKKRGWETTLDTPRGWDGWGSERRAQWVRVEMDQRCRERWRAVLLMLKAKLELVRLGISTVEREFLADLVLPSGKTVAATLEAQIVNVMRGEMPRLLPEAT